MSIERDDKIAPTAHYTAYVWYRIGMPHAEMFATRRGARWFWGMRAAGEWLASALPGVPTMEQYLGGRHRTIEYALGRLQPDRVVELAAGLSRRGVTWAGDRGVKYLEVDLPHMSELKRAIVDERASPALR